MKIKDIDEVKILNDKNLQSKFLSASLNDISVNCKILEGNFFLDSYNYFPITEEFNTFKKIFKWGEENQYNNFYSDFF